MDQKHVVPNQFSDLHLSVGDSFNIESLANNNRYQVRLIGYVEDDSLIVSAPKIKGKAIQLPEGKLLKVRLIAGKYACGFQTQVICSRRLPFLYSHLSYPEKFNAVAIRQGSRVRLTMAAEIAEAEKGTLHGEWPVSARIVDLSSSGARILSKKPLAASGSRLRVSFQTEVDGIFRQHQLQAIVRNIAEADEGYLYGVQFNGVIDEQRVHISGFVYQQMLGRGELAPVS
ncbi:MAG: flagellar brake protein [Motiliproteus sp.]|nr:flagellar brake protein [Motiliproteus sp.]MCW9053374.1 flagellar brake protein [Motiliproteus sp.]